MHTRPIGPTLARAPGSVTIGLVVCAQVGAACGLACLYIYLAIYELANESALNAGFAGSAGGLCASSARRARHDRGSDRDASRRGLAAPLVGAMMPRTGAIRAVVAGAVQGVGFREAARGRARELGLLGWVRNTDDGTVAVHAEGPSAAIEAFIAFLRAGPRGAVVLDVAVEQVGTEGHEQFAIRGVSAGVFVVQEHAATTRHFDLRLEVDGVMRSWAVPKGPSLDPSTKRLAVQVEDHRMEHNAFEGHTDHGGVVLWDRGQYEQGGRVPWPEALDRGHGVFVLLGQKLRGGFALQRTRPGPRPQWLLIKRRDEASRPGSDVVAEQPASVLSGRTLDELLRDAS